eukprot:gb/GFBE01044115.1/.p1 GENE.gb/GFBE01044115.1/~~gb/GFBE01044115.1/.p1  ORF type:complete len:680 (+),score=296.82 gb/GFBE01044115.1/:1-2040(+)
MKMFALVALAQLTSLALADADQGSPMARVIGLLQDMEAKVTEESKAEDEKMEKYEALCARRTDDLKYEITTAKSEIDELEAKIAKADSKLEALDTSIEETQGNIASSESELKAATEVRSKESEDFRASEKDLLDANSAIERAIAALDSEETKGGSSLLQVKAAPGVLEAVQAMMDASIIGHGDAQTLTSLLQGEQMDFQAAAVEKKSGGVVDMLEDMLDKSKDELTELRKKETSAKHSFEMAVQSLQDEIKFAKQDLGKSTKSKNNQQRIRAEAAKDLEQTKGSLAEDEKSLKDFTADCKEEAADYKEESRSRGLELEALGKAKQALSDSMPGGAPSFLQLGQKSSIQSSRDLKHFEAVRIVRGLGQQQHDHDLVLLSRRMDSMLRSESGSGEDVFAKIKTMIKDMIATMEQNLQAEASKKEYCDAEMSKNDAKKASKQEEVDDVSTKIDQASSQAAMLKQQATTLTNELSTLAETQANMTKLRQEEKALFAKNEPETSAGLEGVKVALKTLRDFYKESGTKVTSGERAGAAGGIIGRLEDVEADFATTLSKMRADEKTAEKNYNKDIQDMKLEQTQKEQDVKYKLAESKRLESEAAELTTDSESLATEMSAILEYAKGLEAECLVTPESFAEKQAKKQQEIEGLKEAITALDATSDAAPALLQRQARLRGPRQQHIAA